MVLDVLLHFFPRFHSTTRGPGFVAPGPLAVLTVDVEVDGFDSVLACSTPIPDGAVWGLLM